MKYAYVNYRTTVWRWAEIPYEDGDTEKDIEYKFYNCGWTDDGESDNSGCEEITSIELPEKDQAGEP